MTCPQCGSPDLRFEDCDFGVCSQTGYHDAGERISCLRCGYDIDPRELEAECLQK